MDCRKKKRGGEEGPRSRGREVVDIGDSSGRTELAPKKEKKKKTTSQSRRA